MNERDLTWTLLVELDAYRRRDPERQRMVGCIDLPTFLRRTGVPVEAYRSVADDLLQRRLVGQPDIDQLSVANGGLYITPAGLDLLKELRQEVIASVGLPAGELDPLVHEMMARAWREFERTGRWPTGRSIHKAVRFTSPPGSDVRALLNLIPGWAGSVAISPDESPIYVRLLGLAGGVGVDASVGLEAFWRSVTLARLKFIDAGEGADARLASGDLGGSGTEGTLGMNQLTIRQAWALLSSEHLLASGGGTDNDEQYVWEYQIADRIYDFRDVATLSEYLQVRRVQEIAPATSPALVSPQQEPSGLVQGSQPDPRTVFVIHGRDEQARDAMFGFLRALDLHPLEWEELVRSTGQATPYTGHVVAQAFTQARAVLALLTPDDEVRLHPDLCHADEDADETELRGQPRPNVYFEAGMAFHAQPERTILVEIGKMRMASDLHGLNVIRLGEGPKPLLALYSRLEGAGCAVHMTNADWVDPKRFADLSAYSRHRQTQGLADQALPMGSILRSTPRPASAGLRARLYARGAGSYLLEVMNTGGIPLKDVHWELPPEAVNWRVLDTVLPAYPIPELSPREHVRVPLAISMGGVAMVNLALKGTQPDGTAYSSTSMLSVYG